MLRSLFIAIFPFVALLSIAYSVYYFGVNGFSWGIIGTAITSLTIVAFFGGLFIKPKARTGVILKSYTASILLGTIIGIIISGIVESYHPQIFALVIILSLGWVLYLKWFSVFPKGDTHTLQKGYALPEFQLQNTTKETISSQIFLGKPSIFLFYRGNWCPLCMAQIKEIVGVYKELQKLEVHMIFVSPQPHARSKSLADKYHLDFHFLTDVENKVAQKLGIDVKNGIPAGFQLMGYGSDTAIPTVIIVDAHGEIIFTDITNNYRVRPEPSFFLEVLKKNKDN